MSATVGVLHLNRKPIYVEWKIKDYFSFTEENICLKSPFFFLMDATRWWLTYYQKGSQNHEREVGFYLNKSLSLRKYDITFKLGILKCNGAVLFERNAPYNFPMEETGIGWPNFKLISFTTLEKNLITHNDAVRVFCMVTFAENTTADVCCGTNQSKSLDVMTENYKNLYTGRLHTDLTLNVKGKDFEAHKCVLAARSPVFAAMFEHDMVEKKSNCVSITDCDPESFHLFLLFLYTGKLEEVLPSKLLSLYETADKYDVGELKEECVVLMQCNFSIHTFCHAVFVATKYNETELLKSVIEYFTANISEILRSSEWQWFIIKNPILANKILIKFADRE